jgi:preprotein translocase subunit YajC
MFPHPGWLYQNPDETNTKTEQPAPAPKQRQPDVPGWYTALFFVGLLVIIVFLFWLPQRRQQREREALNTGLNKGDEVLTIAGIYGTVVSVAEKEDEVTVEIAPNVRIKMVKGGIHRNYSAEKRSEQAAKTPASGEKKA